MLTSQTPTTTVEDLETYRRREEQHADAILQAEVERLRLTFPTTPAVTLRGVALGNPKVRRAYNKARYKAISIGRTIRSRQRKAAKEDLLY